MSTAFAHRRFFRFKDKIQKFQSVDSALDIIQLNKSVYQKGNPKTTFALVDNNTSLQMTLEFDTLENQNLFINNANDAWEKTDKIFASGVECWKHEWLNDKGEVGYTNYPLNDGVVKKRAM